MRITVDGSRSETPTGRSIISDKWDPSLQLQKGKSEEAKTLNHFLESIKLKISKDANVLNDSEIDYNAELLKNRFNGVKEQPKTLISIFEENNRLNGIHFIKTETDPVVGTNYSINGTSQLRSVPYALYALIAETAKDAATKANIDTLISQLSKVGAIVADVDGNIYPTVRIFPALLSTQKPA